MSICVPAWQVDEAGAAAIEAGQPVQVLRRDNRQGYKAGAMVEGLNRVEGQGYEYVAIFDADFEPPKVGAYRYHQSAANGCLAAIAARAGAARRTKRNPAAAA